MEIKQLPITVIDIFMRGESCSIGPFSTNGQYLYLHDQPIAYRNESGQIMRLEKPTEAQASQQLQRNENLDIFLTTFVTLSVVGAFFYFMYLMFGGY